MLKDEIEKKINLKKEHIKRLKSTYQICKAIY
jgi:hypothetical protein